MRPHPTAPPKSCPRWYSTGSRRSQGSRPRSWEGGAAGGLKAGAQRAQVVREETRAPAHPSWAVPGCRSPYRRIRSTEQTAFGSHVRSTSGLQTAVGPAEKGQASHRHSPELHGPVLIGSGPALREAGRVPTSYSCYHTGRGTQPSLQRGLPGGAIRS